ncbi:MAG: putative bifunctional diguanylate cyclase/phosphodiesterase [Allorhizobium sp.]
MNPQRKSESLAYIPAIRQAQLRLLMAGHRQTITLNIAISCSVWIIVAQQRGVSTPFIIWMAAIVLALAVRAVAYVLIVRMPDVFGDPKRALKLLTLGALITGLAWAGLPFSLSGMAGTGLDFVIYLIMIGISAGAAIRGIGGAAPSLAFALPPQMAIVGSLLREGHATPMVLAANVLVFMYVTYRSCHAAEEVFLASESAKFEATSLAQSLSLANDDILRTNSRLEVLANGDPITGLANRTLFNSRLKSDIAAAADTGDTVGLLLIDLDRFKSINDTLGHSAGDMVLSQIARRLRDTVAGDGLVARLGGDEFAVIYHGADARKRAVANTAELLECSRLPLMIGTTASVVGVSVGIAAYPEHADSAEELLACADMALYEAKANGRRQMREFDPALKSRNDRQRRIERDLESAIGSGAVEVWFQPQVNLGSGEITGFEALIRWTHPLLGAIAPPEIVQAAQIMHMSDILTGHVATAACRLLNRLPQLGLAEATVALNVSPTEFTIYSVADLLERITGQHGITPALLEVEITEEAILDTLSAGEQLKRMETAGYKLAVDDFGMGHSSLAYLISLKIDRLKIDRSFARDVSKSRTNQKLIAALVGLGRSLALDVVVEGVETLADAEVLAMLGCRVAQGYYFARPMATGALEDWIAERSPSSNTRAVA